MFSLRTLRIKAMQYLFAHYLQKRAVGEPLSTSPLTTKAQQKIQDHLAKNIETIYHLHSSFLQLITTWASIEKERANRLIDPIPTPLFDDPLLTQLRNDPTFLTIAEQYPSLFSGHQVEKWYDGYVHDMASQTADPAPPSSDKSVAHTLLHYISQQPMIQESAAQHDIFWEEDSPFFLPHLRRTVKSFAQDPDHYFAFYQKTLPKDKADFYMTLITTTLTTWESHTDLLQEQVQHWSVERINLMDRLLIHMTLTEIAHLPDIPHKVSINEYLEIAKRYSTPKSAAFINGVVDQISKTSFSL